MRGHIRKRGKSFEAVVYLGKDPQTGKKRYKSCTWLTRREAEAQLHHLIAQAQAGTGVPPSRLRFGDYLEQWLRDYATSALRPATLRSYTNIVRHHFVPTLGHLPLARLSPQAIQGFLGDRLQKGLSPTTVLYHYRVLHESLRHAMKWGLLPRNPADHVDPPRRRRLEMRVWDEEQVRLFLAEAKRSSRHYVLFLAAILTGMRQGELLGLRWQDVDFTFGTFSIQQAFYRLGKWMLFDKPKTAKARRRIYAPEVLLNELGRLRECQREERALLGPEYEDHDLVFCQPNGKPLHAHNVVERDFKRLIRRTDLPRIRFHDLRHCHATLLLKQGEHPKVVQERLGHSTAAFTLDVYSHVLPGMQEGAARRLASRLLEG